LLTAVRVRARARISPSSLSPLTGGPTGGTPARKGERGVIWYEQGLTRRPTPIYDGDSFRPGMEVTGPAIVEFVDTTLVVRHGQSARVDDFGSVAVSV